MVDSVFPAGVTDDVRVYASRTRVTLMIDARGEVRDLVDKSGERNECALHNLYLGRLITFSCAGDNRFRGNNLNT